MKKTSIYIGMVLGLFAYLTGSAMAAGDSRAASGLSAIVGEAGVASAASPGFVSLGNVAWEELISMGFDSQRRAIVGIIAIKLAGGYNNNHVIDCWIDANGDGVFNNNSEYEGGTVRFTPNPTTAAGASLPVHYAMTIPVSPKLVLNKAYKTQCTMTWVQHPTSPTFLGTYGNKLIGSIMYDAEK